MKEVASGANSALSQAIVESNRRNTELEAELKKSQSLLKIFETTQNSNVLEHVKKAEDKIKKELQSKIDSLNEELKKNADKAAEDKQVEIAKTASKEEERKKLESQLAEQLEKFEAEKAEEKIRRQEHEDKLASLQKTLEDESRKVEEIKLENESEKKRLLEEHAKSLEAIEAAKKAEIAAVIKEKDDAIKDKAAAIAKTASEEEERKMLELQLAKSEAEKVEENKKRSEYERKLAAKEISITDFEKQIAEKERLRLEVERLKTTEEAAKRVVDGIRIEIGAANLARQKAEEDNASNAGRVATLTQSLRVSQNLLQERTNERDAARVNLLVATRQKDESIIDAANKERSRLDAERLRLEAERLKTTEEAAKNNALARLTASERDLSDLQKSSSHELSIARSQRDKALEEIEILQKKLEKQSSAPEHKIIREFEKAFKPNYKKACDLLFEGKTEEVKKNEIDYYRNHRHKIYQDDDAKFAHTKIDLSEASDEEVMKEIAKDRERAVRNSLPKLVKKLIGRNNSESVIEKLSCTDIVIALSVGNSEEFNQWKKENPDANIINTFFGKLEKGSKEQEIRSKAIENLLEGIKGYAAFFGVDDSKVLEPDIKPNNSPRILTIDGLAKKFKSRFSDKSCAA